MFRARGQKHVLDQPNMSDKHAAEPVWYTDPVAGLLRPDRMAILVPRPDMTLEQQLNAVVRFALLYAALLLLFRRGRMALLVLTLALLITYAVHRADALRGDALQQRMEKLAVEQDPVTRELRAVGTVDNPYANVLLTDYADFPNRPPAADLTDARVAARAEKAADHNVYRNPDDVFQRVTSNRAFYTMPNTQIPNSQDDFARWLYGAPPTCKEGAGERCAARLYRRVPGS